MLLQLKARLSGVAVRAWTQRATIFTAGPLLAGGKWRLEQGLGKCGNEYGPLVDIPDWSYADGRPAPLGPSEVRRRLKQRELAGRAMQLISELKFAKKRHASRSESEIRSTMLGSRRPIDKQ